MKKEMPDISFGFLPYVIVAAVAIIVFAVLLYIQPLVAVIYAIGVIFVAVGVLTRTLRKRLKAEMQIKKLCKTEKYRFIRKRKLLKSFKWDTEQPDFILSTGKYTYYVHYLTVSRYRSSLTFESKDGIVYKVTPLNNNFNLALSAKEHKKFYKTAFPPLPEETYGKIGVRVVLVNPVCGEMFERDPDGGLTSTGNGMSKYGYTVMTGSGFTETVRRNERSQKETKKF